MAPTDPESRHHPGCWFRVGLDFLGTEFCREGAAIALPVAIALSIVMVAIALLSSKGCNCTLRLQLHFLIVGAHIYLCRDLCCEVWAEGTQSALGPLTSVRARLNP